MAHSSRGLFAFYPFFGCWVGKFRKTLHDYSTRMITVIFSFFATLSWGWGSNIGCHHWKCQEVPRTKGSLAAHWHVLLHVVSFFNVFCFIYKHFFLLQCLMFQILFYQINIWVNSCIRIVIAFLCFCS